MKLLFLTVIYMSKMMGFFFFSLEMSIKHKRLFIFLFSLFIIQVWAVEKGQKLHSFLLQHLRNCIAYYNIYFQQFLRFFFVQILIFLVKQHWKRLLCSHNIKVSIKHQFVPQTLATVIIPLTAFNRWIIERIKVIKSTYKCAYP